ncbi:MAG TPA: hypothetical protein VIS05_02770 [Ilumatobacter sp.]
MKLFEPLETDQTVDLLPELPPEVEVPDDLSGIHPPQDLRPTTGGVRWMRWLAAVVLLAAAGVVTTVIVMNSDEADEAPVDYMQMYGTDNPTFVDDLPGPRSMVIAPPERSLMELYGTDNPTFVERLPGAGEQDTGEYLRMYGTDNPEFLPEPSFMDKYGTDNPTFVEP